MTAFYFYIFASLWLLRETKALLFWLYLWQLKDYHFGRLLAHFHTEKGKKIFFNPVFIFKAALFVFALSGIFLPPQFISLIWVYIVSVLILAAFYFFESIKFLIDFLQKQAKMPVLTIKGIALVVLGLAVEIAFLIVLFRQFYFIWLPNLYWFSFYALVFDILTPIVATIIVFFVHFFTVSLFRSQIIKKARKKREQFKNLLVIAITGSFGKTSTKEFLYEILSKKFNVLKTQEHQNSEVGVSRCILNDLKKGHEIFICEMGAYNKGGIKLLCGIVKPKIGIITGANEQHLATFGSMENLLSAEGGKELIRSLPADGMAFFNAKNEYSRDLYKRVKMKKFLYGENAKLAGMENIEAAKMVAEELGMGKREISQIAEKISRFPGIAIRKGIMGLAIIDATYSSNPDAVMAHLELLKAYSGKKAIIMPCLIELGKASKEIHKNIGRKIAETCDLAIITTKERFPEIKEFSKEKATYMENPKQILMKIKSFLGHGDVVLLESRVSPELIKNLVL